MTKSRRSAAWVAQHVPPAPQAVGGLTAFERTDIGFQPEELRTNAWVRTEGNGHTDAQRRLEHVAVSGERGARLGRDVGRVLALRQSLC